MPSCSSPRKHQLVHENHNHKRGLGHPIGTPGGKGRTRHHHRHPSPPGGHHSVGTTGGERSAGPREEGTNKPATMTNPPSVASQGSGGTQTYPKSILKKSVQAAFEGEMHAISTPSSSAPPPSSSSPSSPPPPPSLTAPSPPIAPPKCARPCSRSRVSCAPVSVGACIGRAMARCVCLLLSESYYYGNESPAAMNRLSLVVV